MIQEKIPINKEWLTRTTGDPFADVGGLVIQKLWEQNPNKTILQLIEDTAKIYVNHWSASLGKFFLNSTITQPAFKGERKIRETLKFYRGLIDKKIPYEEGYCRILGEHTELFTAGRNNHILSGSGTFMNFHHMFQGGLMLSKEILIRIFFVPFGTEMLGKYIALINSNNTDANALFVNQVIQKNQDKIGNRSAEGVLRSDFNKPANAVFDFAHSCINHPNIKGRDNVHLNLIHFQNYAAEPTIQIYCLKANVYKFYAWVSKHRKVANDWKLFIRKHYRNSKAKDLIYNEKKEIFEYQLKKKDETADFETFKNWYNPVLKKLLDGEDILYLILNWVKNRKQYFNLQILKTYQIYIRNMKKETFEIIERIAEYVVNDKSKLPNRLNDLNKCGKGYEFKKVLKRLQRDNYQESNSEVLIKGKDFTDYLFPDEGTFWSDVHTVLLIVIYEKLHKENYFINEKMDKNDDD
ncbi:MAG: type I-B CRISPR-associated protein Cas8b1/Cst1 [Saprospiraceae bacterium]